MCYLGYVGAKSAELLTATEDIVCYKVVTKHIKWKYLFPFVTYRSAIIRSHVWKFGVILDKVNINPDRDTYSISIEEGYHSYTLENKSTIMIAKRGSSNRVIIKCIIPKGTSYYSNGNESVSEQIIALKTVRKIK